MVLPTGTPPAIVARLAAGVARIVQLPEVPTVAEAALPGFEYDGWYGFVAPAKTPRAVVLKLNAAIVRILESTEIREKLLAQGAVVRTGTPEAFEKLIREEIVTRRKIFQAAGAKPL